MEGWRHLGIELILDTSSVPHTLERHTPEWFILAAHEINTANKQKKPTSSHKKSVQKLSTSDKNFINSINQEFSSLYHLIYGSCDVPCGAKTYDFLRVTSSRLDMVDKRPWGGTPSSATASSHAPAIKLVCLWAISPPLTAKHPPGKKLFQLFCCITQSESEPGLKKGKKTKGYFRTLQTHGPISHEEQLFSDFMLMLAVDFHIRVK